MSSPIKNSRNKIRMPRTRVELERLLTHAFLAGCNHGYGVEHSVNVQEQENLGVQNFLGYIPEDKFYDLWDKLKNEE